MSTTPQKRNEKGQTKLERIAEIYRPGFRDGNIELSDGDCEELKAMWKCLGEEERAEREALLGFYAVTIGGRVDNLEEEWLAGLPPAEELERKIAQLLANGFKKSGNRLVPIDRYAFTCGAEEVDDCLVRLLVGGDLNMRSGKSRLAAMEVQRQEATTPEARNANHQTILERLEEIERDWVRSGGEIRVEIREEISRLVPTIGSNKLEAVAIDILRAKLGIDWGEERVQAMVTQLRSEGFPEGENSFRAIHDYRIIRRHSCEKNSSGLGIVLGDEIEAGDEVGIDNQIETLPIESAAVGGDSEEFGHAGRGSGSEG